MDKVQIPKPEDFFLCMPLYEVISWEGEEVFDVVKMLEYKKTIDSYCLNCGKESTFKAIENSSPLEITEALYKKRASVMPNQVAPKIPPGTYNVTFQCARSDHHLHRFIFLVSRKVVIRNKQGFGINSIQKIGQHPSFADLNLPKVKRYSPVLSKEAMGELVRAIGLASHDVGVGAYVYLRRIFEVLVEETHEKVSKTKDWDEEKYNRSRMKEKIQLLKDELPDFIVSHPEMYALLSKGVHELSEQECLKHFGTLQIAIELILDEKLEHANNAKKIEKAKKAIKDAAAEVNGKS